MSITTEYREENTTVQTAARIKSIVFWYDLTVDEDVRVWWQSTKGKYQARSSTEGKICEELQEQHLKITSTTVEVEFKNTVEND